MPDQILASHLTEPVMHAEPIKWIEGPIPASPPLCRAEISLSPESLSAVGSMADHLPAVGGLVLLLSLSVVIVRIGRWFVSTYSSRREPDIVPQCPAVSTPVPFGSREMALCVAMHENADYWQLIMTAFSDALASEGYAFLNDADAKVTLSHRVRERAGLAILHARYRYLAPLESKESIERLLQEAAANGLAESWATRCQQGAEAAGWYAVRRDANMSDKQ